MLKNKRKFKPNNGLAKRQKIIQVSAKENESSAEELNDGYDSMVENGTSEDSYDGSEMSENEEDVAPQKDKSVKIATKCKAATLAGAATSKKPAHVEKVKPPTLEEINELKETRNLFHSNLFRLQVKEMLAELQVKEKYKNYINSWLEQFKAFLRKLPTAPEKEDVNEMQWLRQTVLKVPLALERLRIHKQKNLKFQYVKSTTEPMLIGAAGTQTLMGTKLLADICVFMPAECFQKDNYLNLAYDQKRAFYLTYIASKMLASQWCEGIGQENLKFNYYANNPLKPILEITPPTSTGNIATKLMLRLFVAAEEKSFKLNRFVPWNNNIRGSLFGDNDEDMHAVPLATPTYNASVLADLTLHQNQLLLQETFAVRKNFQEGLVLLKVWLQQRQLHIGFSGFGAHILAALIAFLAKQRKLHANMSSYQVARTVWNYLAFSALDESGKGISLCTNADTTANQPTLEQFHAHYDVVFIDASGFYNICAQLSLEMYRRVRMEAKLAVDMLNDMKLNSFQLLFMTKCPLYSQFDHILKVNKADIIEQILDMHVLPADKYNFAGYAYPQLLKVITSLLRKGLEQRASTLLPIEQATEAWCVQEEPSGCAEYLHLGIILNPEHAFEILNKGPESIADGAEEFRKFWGDKAQLRRFQDGSITESVVWAASTDSLTKKRLVVRSIVLHLLQYHFQLDADDVEYVGGEFDIVYKLTPAFKVDNLHEKSKVQQDTDAEVMSLTVIRSFDDLARKLHGLNELPLEIVGIAGISPAFRYCEPAPALPLARCINDKFYAPQVHRGVIQLGLSGKWPSELAALRALKTAFYIQIAQLLRDKHHLRTKVTYDGVLVLKQGYCFAIEIAHPKEVALLKREKTDRGITQYVDCAQSIKLEKCHYVLPKVSGALHALYQLHPSYGGTVMIAKRWLYSQLIDDGLWPDECTELLIASQYVKSSAQQITCSPQTGFIRFLQLLSHTDWQSELFVVNFNHAMDDDQISDLEQRFSTARDTFPPLCIVTAYDQKYSGLLWSTQSEPNVNVLARVTILARQTLSIVEAALLSTDPFIKPSRIFTASNQGYDLVIQLKPDIVPNTLAFEFGSPFVAFTKPNWRLPLADTNFLKRAVTNLREAYSSFAAFFYNPCGGKEIGVIWKPSAFAAKDFKVADVSGCTLSADDPAKIQCLKETLIEDFKFILRDFYLRIDSVDSVLSVTREAYKNQMASRYFVQQLGDSKPPKIQNGGKPAKTLPAKEKKPKKVKPQKKINLDNTVAKAKKVGKKKSPKSIARTASN